MEEGNLMKSVFKGLTGAVILTLMLLVILSLIMTKFELTEKVYNIVYVVLTTFSLVVGAAFAAKSNNKKGWLSGLSVGFLFFIFIYLLGSIVNGSFSFELVQLYKLGGSLVVGIIAGILGVNL